MTLSDYPSEELRILQLAIAVAQESSKKILGLDEQIEGLKIWADRIDEAIHDATFEEENLFL